MTFIDNFNFCPLTNIVFLDYYYTFVHLYISILEMENFTDSNHIIMKCINLKFRNNTNNNKNINNDDYDDAIEGKSYVHSKKRMITWIALARWNVEAYFHRKFIIIAHDMWSASKLHLFKTYMISIYMKFQLK